MTFLTIIYQPLKPFHPHLKNEKHSKKNTKDVPGRPRIRGS